MLTYTVGQSCEYELEQKDWPYKVFDPEDKIDVALFAESCAEHYRDDHDGWECWRDGEREVALFWNGELVGEFEVLMEYEPTYTAYTKTS